MPILLKWLLIFETMDPPAKKQDESASSDSELDLTQEELNKRKDDKEALRRRRQLMKNASALHRINMNKPNEWFFLENRIKKACIDMVEPVTLH